MTKKTGVIVFTHGSRLTAGNDIMIRLVEKLRTRLSYDFVEPCFMEISQPDIPAAIEKLVARGCNHIFGYAFFLVPGRHLQEDIPAIIERTLKKHPGITYEVTEPMMDDPALLELVEKRIAKIL